MAPDNELASAAAKAPEVDLTTFGRKTGQPSRNTIWITTDEQRRIHIRSGQGLVRDWSVKCVSAPFPEVRLGGTSREDAAG